MSNNMQRCIWCEDVIPEARLKAIPSCTTCVKCSKTQPYRGYNVFPHKTGSSVQIINPNTANSSEVIRQADRANKRSR